MPHGFKLSHRLSRLRVVGLLSTLGLAACSSTDQATSPVNAQDSARNSRTVTVTPSSLSGTVGQTGQFSAVVKDGWGRVISGAIVTWTSSDPTVVGITASGLATALKAGSVTVTASSGGYKGTATASVSSGQTASAPGAVSDLATSAATDSSVVLTFTEVSDGTGAPAGYEVRYAAGTISWGTAAPAVSGTCGTPLAGSSIGNKRSCTVTGLTAGTSYQFQVVAFRGTLNQNAVFGALSNVATGATIAQIVVGAVTVSPTAVSGSVGQTGQFSAAVTDPSGAPITGQKVSWASSSNSVVTIDSTGLATAKSAGSATVSATCLGKSGSAQVTVSGGGSTGQAATITISPTSASAQVGGTQVFIANVKDASGNVLTGQNVSFTSSNTGVGTVDNLSGMVNALATGSTTITATDGSLSAHATLTVTAAQPPPPSGGGVWANEPTGTSFSTDDPFDSLNEHGWQAIWNTAGNGTIAQDPTAPLSPSNVFQVTYPTGFAAGAGPATEMVPLPSLRRAYVGIWWKVSNPWQGNPTNVNKIEYLMTPNSIGSIFLCMYGTPGGPYELRVFPQFTSSTLLWLTPNVNHVPVTLGVWHKIEWLVDYTGSTSRIQWWLDGVLIGDYSGDPDPGVGLNEYHMDPVWGGVEGVKTETDHYWYDHAHISGN